MTIHSVILLFLLSLAPLSAIAQTAPVITSITPPRQVVTLGESLTLAVTATNASSYQWSRNNQIIPGATSSNYTISNIQRNNGDGWYNVRVANIAGPVPVSVISPTIFVLIGSSRYHVSSGVGVHGAAASAGIVNHIDGVVDAKYIKGGGYLLLVDGSVSSWSSGYVGRPFGDANRIVAIAAGNDHSLYLSQDGTVAGINYSSIRGLDVPGGLSEIVAIAAGGNSSAAIKKNGDVIVWGEMQAAGLSGAASVALGDRHGLVLRIDGRVDAWGSNQNGQTAVPVGLSRVIQIAAGSHHSIALKDDGTIVQWGGSNISNMSTGERFSIQSPPNGISEVVAISAGNLHGMALRRDGRIITWGAADLRMGLSETLTGVVGISGGAYKDFGLVIYDSSGARPPSVVSSPSDVEVGLGGTAQFTTSIYPEWTMSSWSWRQDGSAVAFLPGAHSRGFNTYTLSIPSVSAQSAGYYEVQVSNYLGSATSARAKLTVLPPTRPSVTSGPLSTAVKIGEPLTLNVVAKGSPVPSVQWLKDGAPISGATGFTYSIPTVALRDAGAYTARVQNAIDLIPYSATSTAAVITVLSSRLINLSILTPLASGESMTLGTVLGGSATSGNKALLIRGAGPSLAPLGVTDFMPDPTLTVYRGQTTLATNDNWGGSATLAGAFTAVGAFSYASTTSRDAAYYSTALAPGAYTVQVRGLGTSSGTVIAELYDATAAANVTAATPRLVNVSVLKEIRAGDTLTAGFVVGGNAPKNILVRAIGPALGLAPFNIGGVMADPRLSVYSGQTVLASNDNWGTQSGGVTSAALTAAFDSVGAFRIADPASRDAALLLTLNPGNYTAVVSSANGGAGLLITEVYEVP
jgi:hypothetical protein